MSNKNPYRWQHKYDIPPAHSSKKAYERRAHSKWNRRANKIDIRTLDAE